MGYLNVVNLTWTESNWSFIVEKRKLKEKQYVRNVYLIIIEGIIKCSKSFF